MSNESIELYKPWTPGKITFPVMVQEKYDGVPVRIRNIGGHIFAWTRQNEKITSIEHIMVYARLLLSIPGSSFTGELHIADQPFKVISGLARRNKASPELILRVFDYDCDAMPGAAYSVRRARFIQRLDNLSALIGKARCDLPLSETQGVICRTPDDAELAFNLIMQMNPKAEGAVAHSTSKQFTPGKRVWTTQKMLKRPTIDLLITGFEEANDKYGRPMAMVGRLNAEYNRLVRGSLRTTEIGIGPGALTNNQRKALWQARARFTPTIAEIRYKPDDTYEALREPTFVRFRTDKKEADHA